MAAKATVDEVKALGFTFEMFKKVVATEPDFDTYVQTILDDKADELIDEIGATAYNDAENLSKVKRCEKYMVAAELWELRANFVLANRRVSNEESSKIKISEMLNAEIYAKKAQAVIDKINGIEAASDIAVGVVVSEH